MKALTLCCFIVLLFSASIALANDDLVHRQIKFTHANRTEQPPRLDGDLQDACWQKAVKISNFVLTAGQHGQPAKYPTTAYLLYDDTHLYVAFRCTEPDIDNLKITSKMTDDDDILYDDRVEVFLDVNHDHRSYYELAVNPDGVQFDQSCFNRLHGSKTCDMNPAWNCFWRAKTRIGEKEWTAEIAIDVTTLGIAKIEKGMTWGLNLARVRQPDVKKGDEFFKRKPGPGAEYSAWVPVKDYIRETISNFHAPLEFGDMVFGDPGFVVEEIALRSALYAFGPVGSPSLFGRNPLELKIDPQGVAKDLILHLKTQPPSVKEWEAEQLIQVKSDQPVRAWYYMAEDGENKLIITLLDAKSRQQLYRTSYIELVPPFIEFDLYSLYTRNPQPIAPVRFKLLTDQQTRLSSRLKLKFIDPANHRVIESAGIENLDNANEFVPVFDVEKLRALPGGNYAIDCKLFDKENDSLLVQFSQKLTKFDLHLPTDFRVVEGKYNYGGLTDHGVWIEYPFPARFVFWRSASYIPFWDIDQAVMTNEFIECWGAGNQGCNEPMQDRECRYITVDVVEKSPARAVVHWRYALSDPHYRIYRNEWVDEYYVMYPDGVGIRQVNLWPNSNTRHEMFEVLLAKPPCVHTEQLYEKEFATLSNLNGQGYSNKYFYNNKKFYYQFLEQSDDFIIEVHFKDRLHPFTVFSFRPDLLPNVPRDHVTACARIIEKADQRGHWPASRYQIDGYNTVGLDVPNHGNIGNIQADVDSRYQPMTWMFLIGVKEKGSDKDRLHARSWLYPAQIKIAAGDFQYTGYDFSQRAYSLKAARFAPTCRLVLSTGQDVIINPVFKIINPGSELKSVLMDKKNVSRYRAGSEADGSTIIFFNKKFSGDSEIVFEFTEKTQGTSKK